MPSQEGSNRGWISLISDYTDRVAKFFLAVMMAVMIVDVLFGVFNRFLFKIAVSWVEEIATYLLIWVSLLGSAVATRMGGHVGVGLIVSRLRGRVRTVVSWVSVWVVLCFIISLIFLGTKLAIREMHQLGHATRISMFWPFLSIPVGSLMILIQLVYIMSLLAKQKEPYGESQVSG